MAEYYYIPKRKKKENNNGHNQTFRNRHDISKEKEKMSIKYYIEQS